MFLPENIDLARSEKYNLSIRLTPDGFSFCIVSVVDKSVYHYQQTAFSRNQSQMENIKKIFFEVNFFSLPFRETSVTVVSPRYTAIPRTFFRKQVAKDLFEFNLHGISGQVLDNPIDQGGYHLLFDMEEPVYAFLLRNLCNPSFFCHTTRLLPYFTRYRVEEGRKRCFVDFDKELVTVISFSRGELLSANSYAGHDRFDRLYHIVSAWESQIPDQNNDPLYLSGDLDGNKESIDTLKQLIRRVEAISPTANHPATGETLPTDLLLQLCE